MSRKLNDIIVEGIVMTEPVLSHKVSDMNFYKFDIVAASNTGTSDDDIITLMIPGTYWEDPNYYFERGDVIMVHGELGSYINPKNKETSRYVYVHHLAIAENQLGEQHRVNSVRLEATVTKLRINEDVTIAYLIAKKGNKVTLSLMCNLKHIPEETIERIEIGNEIFVLGEFKGTPYTTVEQNGRQTKIRQEILATDIFC